MNEFMVCKFFSVISVIVMLSWRVIELEGTWVGGLENARGHCVHLIGDNGF